MIKFNLPRGGNVLWLNFRLKVSLIFSVKFNFIILYNFRARGYKVDLFGHKLILYNISNIDKARKNV